MERKILGGPKAIQESPPRFFIPQTYFLAQKPQAQLENHICLILPRLASGLMLLGVLADPAPPSRGQVSFLTFAVSQQHWIFFFFNYQDPGPRSRLIGFRMTPEPRTGMSPHSKRLSPTSCQDLWRKACRYQQNSTPHSPSGELRDGGGGPSSRNWRRSTC